MSKAFLNLHLHIEPPSPAKTQASRKPPSHEPRSIKLNSSSSRVTSIKTRKTQTPIPSVKTLLSHLNSGSLEPALQLFDTMTDSGTFAWNVMIRGLVDSEMFEEAIDFYNRMQLQGIKPDKFTFPSVIKACAGISCLTEGQRVHSAVIKLGFGEDIYICNSLIKMYAKVGCIEGSEKVFGWMPVKDLVSWNSMIGGYVSSGDGLSSMSCLRKMQELGVRSDRFSYISALGACTLERCLPIGKEVFCQVLRNGMESDSMIQSSLIDMFGKCGGVVYAERFSNIIPQKNIVVWNSMIGAYVANDKSSESFACLVAMKYDDDVEPDTITLINLLPSVSKLRALLKGKAIHGYAIRKGYLHHFVLETALVDMYGKCGCTNLSKRVFCLMKAKNLVSWNSMISVFVQNLKIQEAIETFQDLLHEPCVPDEMTFSSILAAYAEIALPKEGKQVHCHIIKSGVSSGTFVSNALIHMYARCGDLESGQKVFNLMLFKDLISWNTIIMAYALHGFGEYCFSLFSSMLTDGYKPNGSTFISVLSACSIAGIADGGWKYFDSMKRDYGVDPGIEHYGCMLDLLGREGNLDRMKIFIEQMPLTPSNRIWGSLLSASRRHNNIELAEMAVEKILSLDNDNDNTGCYMLLSNMYAEQRRWEDVERVRGLMKTRGLVKTDGFSVVECGGNAYRFINYDKSHSESNTIYKVLDILSKKVGEENLYYGAESKSKLKDLLKKRGDSPSCHSVRLAICFGLIGKSVGEPVVIRKNVRVCEDCHVAVKKMSRVTNREIVVGDSKIYHRFRGGRCSCGDYW